MLKNPENENEFIVREQLDKILPEGLYPTGIMGNVEENQRVLPHQLHPTRPTYLLKALYNIINFDIKML